MVDPAKLLAELRIWAALREQCIQDGDAWDVASEDAPQPVKDMLASERRLLAFLHDD